ncbi:MAG: hypothetical protein AABY75_02040, partial [Bacteroidota bacterium]
QIRVVQETLVELDAADRTTLMVFNKVDRLEDRTLLNEVARAHPSHVFISATRGINLLGLKEAIHALVRQEFCELVVRMPHMEQRSISQIFDLAEVSDQRYEGDEAFLTLRVAVREEQRLRQMVKESGGVLLSPPRLE